MSGGKYNATDFDIRIDEVVKLNSPTWNYLSMHYMHKIIDGDMYYSSLYRLAYSLAYPSKVKFINNSITDCSCSEKMIFSISLFGCFKLLFVLKNIFFLP